MSDRNYQLLIDTFSGVYLGLFQDNQLLHSISKEAGLVFASDSLGKEIQTILNHFQLEVQDLSEIWTTLGPGSFTGLRIGLAYIQGLSIPHHIPVKAQSSLAWLHYSFEPAALVLIPARNGFVYTFRQGQEIFCSLEELAQQTSIPWKKIIWAGPAGTNLPFLNTVIENLEGQYPFQQAGAFFSQLPIVQIHQLKPNYLVEPLITLKKS